MPSERIRELNDFCRRTVGIGGYVRFTPGISRLGSKACDRIVRKVQRYEDFDPEGEHSFGAFQDAGQTIFFRIDYYDRALARESDDPADPVKTHRVLTIMLADEPTS